MRVPGLSRLVLELSPALELGNERPLVVFDGDQKRILSPYPVRGRLDVGLSFGLL
jgi:hypothetical protein